MTGCLYAIDYSIGRKMRQFRCRGQIYHAQMGRHLHESVINAAPTADLTWAR